jgi:methyl-accepting chemotaxis protein
MECTHHMKNLSTSKKLRALVAIMLVLMVIANLVSFQYLGIMRDGVEDLYKNRVLAVQWLDEMRIHTRAAKGSLSDMIVFDEVSQDSPMIQDIQTRMNKLPELISLYSATKLDQYELERLDKLIQLIEPYRKNLLTAIELMKNGKTAEAKQLSMELYRQSEDINFLLVELDEYNVKLGSELNERIGNDYGIAVKMMILILLLSFIFGGGLGFYINRMVTIPIRKIQGLMVQAEAGDLITRGDYISRDELGQLTDSYNNMMNGIQQTMTDIQMTAEQVAASSYELSAIADETGKGSEHIATIIQEMAEGSKNQVQMVSEGSASIQSVSMRMTDINQSAHEAVKLSSDAASRAAEGSESVRHAAQQIQELYVNIDQLKQVILQLGQRSQQIGDIVQIITEIASQTNLLALNAAIEAARAGEEGRGFAVVAGEVRKLADETGQAAQQIAELIRNVQSGTDLAVDSMQTSAEQASGSLSTIHALDVSFSGIRTAVDQTAAIVSNVSDSVRSALSDADIAVNAIESISAVAEEAAAGAESVTAATEQQLAATEEMMASFTNLSKIAQDAKNLVNKFKLQ